MEFMYVITPFIAWFVTGVLKFLFNSIKLKKMAFVQVGYGGMPSNHSSIVSSMVALIFLREGFNHPAFGVALTFAFIVILDAGGLRQQVSKQAVAINRVSIDDPNHSILRERMGHTKLEISAGILVGCIVALAVKSFFSS